MPSNTNPASIIKNCSTWAHFVQAVSSLSKIEKGRAFERLTQLYLQTKPEYQTLLKDVWRLADIPLRVKRKLTKLPKSDEGIDLVAETRAGEFWAIQCKYKSDKDKALTVKELSTFTNLAFNSCAGQFAKAFVVHSTNKPVRKQKLLGNTTEIGLQRWLELSEEEWRLIHAQLEDKPIRPLKRSPRPHQRKAIDSARTHYLEKKETRGKLLMPCGTGKSLTAFWIAQSLKSKITLVVVPSLSLVKQSVEDWTREFVAENVSPLPEWLCVCSDQSVGNVSKDEFVESVYDLGLPVTTDKQEIQAFLKKQTPAQRIVFVTYQSSPIFAQAARSAKVKIDFAIMDEAHKTAGEKSKTFSTLLFDENLKIQRRMFMTATERVMRGSHDDVVSMDDPDTYGDCIYHLSFKEAIHSEPSIISDYKILTVFVTEDEIKTAIQEQNYVTDSKSGIEAEDARYIAAAIALRKAYRQFEIKHAVSFHRSIRAASDFATLQERLNSLKSLRPKIECFHISSQKTAGERTEVLESFAASQRSLITNAKCLTEGVDVPAIDCVLFADPKQSTVDIVQAAGRALRPYSGKKFGYIMLPIIVPDGMSFEAFAESTDFRAVSKVITSLSTQDERIAEEFRVSDKAKSSRDKVIEFTGSLPVGIKIDLKDFAEAVSAKVWERVARVNWRDFEDARGYVHELSIQSNIDWRTFIKSGNLPKDIPASPDRTYKDEGWISWGDWLGTGRIADRDRQFRKIEEAKEFVHKLNLKSGAEWREFTKSGDLPKDIPAYPNQTYKDKGWISWGDWLGTGKIWDGYRQYRTIEEAKAFVQELKLKSNKEWRTYIKSANLPNDIPANPDETYKDKGWISWGDWLGTGRSSNRNKQFLSIEDARSFVHKLELKSNREWREYIKSGKLPDNIPSAPNHNYKNKGWISWGDWLGTGRIADRDRQYRTIEEAKKFVHKLKLVSVAEWSEYTKSGKLPDDIPATPSQTYKDEGWESMGDWLGTGTVAPRLRQYRSFEEARTYAQGLKLKSVPDWLRFTKSGDLPKDIPATPDRTYKNKGWISWGDWLGTGTIAPFLRNYLSYEEAKAIVHKLNLKSGADWKKYTQTGNLPENIPSAPNIAYKDKGWKSMGDWLGTGTVANYFRRYRNFDQAKAFVQNLNLKSGAEWREFTKSGNLPKDIPAYPNQTYKDKGWTSMGDWLGTGTIAPNLRQYQPFEEAKAFVQNLNLKSGAEWIEFTKSGNLPKDIPANPYQTYKDKGWNGMGDWLGTGTVAPRFRQYQPFEKAKAFVQNINLKSGAEWREFTKSGNLPDDIPATPERTYKDKGWTSMGDWLGTGTIASYQRKFLPYNEAKLFVRNLNLKSQAEWRSYVKSGNLPDSIPSAPNHNYKNKGWISWGDWLGTGFIATRLRKYRSYPEARAYVQKLNLKSGAEWIEFTKFGKLPDDIPINPVQVYKNTGWKGMGDWLGTGTIAPNLRQYRSFQEARAFAQKLRLNSQKDWFQYTKSGNLPKDIPAYPNQTYKDKGWTSMGDWLGKN